MTEVNRNSIDKRWRIRCAWVSLLLASTVFLISIVILGVILGFELKQGYAVIVFLISSGVLYVISVVTSVVHIYRRGHHSPQRPLLTPQESQEKDPRRMLKRLRGGTTPPRNRPFIGTGETIVKRISINPHSWQAVVDEIPFLNERLLPNGASRPFQPIPQRLPARVTPVSAAALSQEPKSSDIISGKQQKVLSLISSTKFPLPQTFDFGNIPQARNCLFGKSNEMVSQGVQTDLGVSRLTTSTGRVASIALPRSKHGDLETKSPSCEAAEEMDASLLSNVRVLQKLASEDNHVDASTGNFRRCKSLCKVRSDESLSKLHRPANSLEVKLNCLKRPGDMELPGILEDENSSVTNAITTDQMTAWENLMKTFSDAERARIIGLKLQT